MVDCSLDIASLIFLVVLFVLTPRAALRSARVMRQAREAGAPIPRLRIMLSTAFALTVTWLLAQLNATAMRMNLFAMPPIGLREVLIGLAGFAALLSLIPISTAIRTPDKQRKQLVNSLAPRNAREVAAFALLVSPGIPAWHLIPALFVYGLGVGFATAQLTGVILADVPVAASGQASGIQSTSRQIGSALGVAILGVVWHHMVADSWQTPLTIAGIPLG